MQEITYRSGRFYDDIADHGDRHVHLVLIATKPDIIKQVPLYKELVRRGRLAVLAHTGQHYSENLSGGMLKEFGVEPDCNLNVRGDMHEVVSQIIGRLGHVIGEMKRRGKTVIPYVHGDTTTAMAASNAGYCHGFASVHVEAGIRTLTPRYEGEWSLQSEHWERRSGAWDAQAWAAYLADRGNWERGSLEPYPEQFNTRCSEAASGLHLAPVELDRSFLQAEGFPDDRIVVTGNSVVDATEAALADSEHATVFDRYPVLAQGDFVRFCIHRRENCASEPRFRAIYEAMKQLVIEGRTVLLISLFQTEKAIDAFGLRADIAELCASHKNFFYSPVWPEYRDVIAAMRRCAVCATDSGSMQEEMNVLGVPCVTLRFGSDRSESAIGGGNIIAPPVDAWLIKNMIVHAWGNAAMRGAPKLYGRNVSARCIDAVDAVLRGGEMFRAEEERLRL